MHPPWYTRRKSQPLILITYQRKKLGAKRKSIELIPIVKLTLQP